MAAQILTIALFHMLPAWSMVRWLPLTGTPERIAVGAVFLALTLMLIFGRDAAFLRDSSSARVIYRLSMLSFVLVLNLFMASLVHLAVRLFIRIAGLEVPGSVTLIPLFSAAAGAVALGLINAGRLRVRRVLFTAPGFPAAWNGRCIVFFSDTHYGTLNGPKTAGVLVKTVSSLEPDMIICGGDLFDGPGGMVKQTLSQLSGLNAPLGVLAVLGNHDYYYLTLPGSSRELLQRQMKREQMPLSGGNPLTQVKAALPWMFLENQAVLVDGVLFAGLRPFSAEDEKAAKEFLESLNTAQPTILINHKPSLVEEAAAAGVDLQLSGHTHGGPVFPVNLVMRKVFRGRHFGTSRHRGMVLETSSGSGVSLWYPRTAGRHEVVVVEFAVNAGM